MTCTSNATDVTQDPEADTVVLLNPAGGPEPYYIDYGWRGIEGSGPRSAAQARYAMDRRERQQS